MSKFTVLKILLLSLLLSTLGCKKETIEIEKKVFIYSTTDSTIIKDTIIGRPYQWGRINNNQIKKLVDISGICSQCNDVVLDVYWGSGGTNWLRLPWVDNIRNVAVNYQWGNDVLYVFAYGDSVSLADTLSWDRLRLNTLRIQATFKK